MPYITKPIERDQVMLITYDSLIEWNSIARVIDYFVDHLDLNEMGIRDTGSSPEGRPGYPPECLLKLYLYGYRKNIRSSRKLAAACEVNIEVIWLMGGLKPDFRTIADFRKINIRSMKKVYKEFTRRITVDLETGYVSIDGSKFRASNSKDRNFTINKLDERIQWLEDHTDEYLRQIEATDADEDVLEGSFTKEELEEKLAKAQERLDRYRSYRELMERENLTQLSLTDADSRLMKNKNGMDVSYNVQTAVDSETHLMMNYLMTNNATDHGQIAPTMKDLRENAGSQILETVADTGYEQPEDIVACLEQGIIPHVILSGGKDVYDLEIDYEEADADRESTDPEDLT